MLGRIQGKKQIRIAIVFGCQLCIILGLFLALEHHSSTVGQPAKALPHRINSLVENPSFEPPTSTKKCGTGPAPEGWVCAGWQAGHASLMWDPSGGSSGAPGDDHSVMIIGVDDQADAAWSTAATHLFPITAGQQYSFTGWIEANIYGTAQAYLELEFLNDKAKVVGRSRSGSITDSTPGWVRVTGSGVPPTGTVSGRLDARLLGTGFARFDNVAVSDTSIVPFLTINVEAEPTPALPTGILTYVVSMTNTGGYMATSVRLTDTLDHRTTLIQQDPAPPVLLPGEGVTTAHVVAVNVITDSHVPLSSIFTVGADYVNEESFTIRTPLSPTISFEVNGCEGGFGLRAVPIDYVRTITNTSDRPVSFTASLLFVHPSNCADALVYPEDIDSVPTFGTVPVTLTLTPTIAPPNDCLAVMNVETKSPYNAEELSLCDTQVLASPLALEMVGSPDPVYAGQELTYTLSYTYANSIEPDSLRITLTLGEPAIGLAFFPPHDITVSERTYVWQPPTSRQGGTDGLAVIAGIPSAATGFVTSSSEIEAGNSAPITTEVTTRIAVYQIYLPLILRSWTLVPVLYPIDNADINGSYTVEWSEISEANSYTLGESPDEACTNPVEVYSGPDTSYAVDGKAEGRYCYCVKSCTGSTCSQFSNVECVNAWWEIEPNNSCIHANGPLVSGPNYYGHHDYGPDDQKNWDCFWIDLQNDGQVSAALTTQQTEGLQLQLLDQNCDLVGPAEDLCYDPYPPYELGGENCTASKGRNHVCINTKHSSAGAEYYSLDVTLP